jgi:hypothetical protein
MDQPVVPEPRHAALATVEAVGVPCVPDGDVMRPGTLTLLKGGVLGNDLLLAIGEDHPV